MNEENKTVTPDRLTEILYKRAEKKLWNSIFASTPVPRSYFGKWVSVSYLLSLKQNNEGKVHLQDLIERFQEIIFDADKEAAKATEVREFVAKVENAAAELDAIREEINQ